MQYILLESAFTYPVYSPITSTQSKVAGFIHTERSCPTSKSITLEEIAAHVTYFVTNPPVQPSISRGTNRDRQLN